MGTHRERVVEEDVWEPDVEDGDGCAEVWAALVEAREEEDGE